MSALLVGAVSCADKVADEKVIDKPEFKSADGVFSIEALEALGRVSSPVISPDKSKVLYSIAYESVEENRSNADLYVMNTDGSDAVRITRSAKSESNAVWINGGKQIAFLYPDGDKNQVWVMNADGSGRTCVSAVDNGVSGFTVSPDESKIVLISNVKYTRTAEDIYPDLPKATGRVIDDLMYKHWDEWVTEIPHPFLADFDGKKVTNVVDIMADEPYESPMKPFGGVESFAWSPDSKQLIYVSRKKTGMEYALSTNSDLYLYDIASKTTKNITEGMMGYDTAPAYSPDGRYVAWLSMEHDGYESDKNRIFIMDCATGEKTDLTADWDYTADAIAWNPSGKSIYFLAPYQGVTPIFSIDIASKEVSKVIEGVCDYAALAPVDETSLITMSHSMLAPNEIYSVKNGELAQLTSVNKEIFDQLDMPTVEKVMVPTTDGKEMTTWVVYPPKFDKTKRYPSILYCQGGPQQAVSQFWSYRWNLALMASHGYIVIAPNRRGLPGFGTEWNEQISGDYGGQNMKDYLSAVDFMKEKPYVDSRYIGATGASYGGFSVYWLAGNHDKRFACLIAHAGIFNTESQYLETEEMWFANWDLGGPFWDKGNPVAQRTFSQSPHKYVDKWDTPILITHGEYDFRILASQGMMAFNAAKLRGIPAEMLIFPDENHWILKPQNAVMWQRVFFRWLDRWLMPEDSMEEQR
ncbi:MAG TPA: S9 family peptidase [Muribaculum sp.]|jgi:dipeptidyl aminopeptidase/acylaminoacyl peptidase|uniref:S9 family peptidase n=1 Tax=Heminiphilus faecis TaxID=2601703 RepID=A0ABV4CUE3_9BACT|nr:S9 family peptidase [Heminiphilus faecis]HRF68369.1 S9 family peptidase [Muribaculum sp.]